MAKYVVRNNDGSYYQCFTENDTVFLTKNAEKAEKFDSISGAKLAIKWSQDEDVTFLRDEDYSEVKNNVQFQIGTIEYTFVAIE